MKILVSGKGGVGKTTIAAALSLTLSSNGYRVLVVDADSVPNIGQSLGLAKHEEIIPISKNESLIEERTGARPGEGWGIFFSLTPQVDDLVDKYAVKINDKLKLLVLGSIDASKEGCLCPAIALGKALLLRLFTRKDEIIVVDSEAGAEVFGRGLAERFDLNLTVAEPTVKSLKIAKKLVDLAKELNVVNNIVVLNKVVKVREAIHVFNEVFKEGEVPYFIVRYDPNIPALEVKGLGLDSIPKNSTIYEDVSALSKKIIKYKTTVNSKY